MPLPTTLLITSLDISELYLVQSLLEAGQEILSMFKENLHVSKVICQS